ncbi:hypothetical protein HYS95_01945 [Candidatus Daviesbacteria bacterium]|nr:hypothetical protein [Candidatus Daviesbacteria bacterium]
MNSPVEQFREQYARKSDRSRQDIAMQNLISYGPIESSVRVICTIPVHYEERYLLRTLGEYSKQDDLSSFELFLLVNGKRGADITTSPAYNSILEGRQKYPKLNVAVTGTVYPDKGLRIGLVRKDAAMLALTRAAQSGVDVENLILVTNDADSINIPEDYFTQIIKRFDDNPKLGGLAGFVDYPREDFYGSHLFLSVQRFVDIVEVIQRYKNNHLVMRAGNAAFRVRDYMSAGGHTRSRISETRPLYRWIRSAGGEVQFDPQVRIVTSARRQITAIANDIPQSQRYQSFGMEGDLANHYQIAESRLEIPEVCQKVTSSQFPALLEREIQSVYNRYITALYRQVSRSSDRERNLSKSIEDAYARAVMFRPQAVANIQNLMRRAGFFTGIKLDFEGHVVSIRNIYVLKKLILQKFNNY